MSSKWRAFVDPTDFALYERNAGEMLAFKCGGWDPALVGTVLSLV